MERVRIISFTEAGYQLSVRMREVLMQQRQAEVTLYSGKTQIAETYAGAGLQPVKGGLQSWCGEVFATSEVLIFIGACGIAVRAIAPYVNNKYSDPAVLVADERGCHVISLLSGHLGGGNAWTAWLAERIGADPVITTASDVNGRLAIDVWAKKQGLYIADRELAKYAAAAIVAGEKLPFYVEQQQIENVPEELCVAATEEAFREAAGKRLAEPIGGIVVSVYDHWPEHVLRLVPKCLILGIGCRKGKDPAEVETQVQQVLENYHVAVESIAKIVSIDLKAGEAGILQLAKKWKVPFETLSTELLQQVPGTFAESEFVKKTTGVGNVCERAAVAALPEEAQAHPCWICHKQAENGVTVAMITFPFLSAEPLSRKHPLQNL